MVDSPLIAAGDEIVDFAIFKPLPRPGGPRQDTDEMVENVHHLFVPGAEILGPALTCGFTHAPAEESVIRVTQRIHLINEPAGSVPCVNSFLQNHFNLDHLHHNHLEMYCPDDKKIESGIPNRLVSHIGSHGKRVPKERLFFIMVPDVGLDGMLGLWSVVGVGSPVDAVFVVLRTGHYHGNLRLIEAGFLLS